MGLSARTRLIVVGAIGLAVGVGLAGVIALAVWPRRAAAPIAHTSLTPTGDQVRYRFEVGNAPDPRIELDQMIKELERRVQASSQPMDMSELADLYYKRAQAGGEKQDYEASEAMAKRSLDILPAPNGATLTLAKLASARHDFREAIRLARTHHGKTVGIPTVLATSYLALGELAEAAHEANRAVLMKPDSATYLMRALVMQAQGRDDEAEGDFVAAIRVEEFGDPQGGARTRALWGRFLLRRGELAGARMVFDEAIRIAPDYPLAQAMRAELLLRSGDDKQAAAQLEQAFAASRQVRYLIDQATALELAGERANADALRGQVETIVRGELGEGGLGHRLDLVEVLVDRGGAPRITEAVAMAREEVARRGSADARFQLARALARAGSFDEAITEVQAALATGAHEAQIYELASRLEQHRGNAPRAALYAHLARDLDPGNSGWRVLGMP